MAQFKHFSADVDLRTLKPFGMEVNPWRLRVYRLPRQQQGPEQGWTLLVGVTSELAAEDGNQVVGFGNEPCGDL